MAATRELLEAPPYAAGCGSRRVEATGAIKRHGIATVSFAGEGARATNSASVVGGRGRPRHKLRLGRSRARAPAPPCRGAKTPPSPVHKTPAAERLAEVDLWHCRAIPKSTPSA